MAEKTKLVRRTITEEYVAPDLDSETEDDEDVEDESEQDDEPRKRRR